jgi:ppGpp synthetase/RelA/SpoT-type nucleotidyltranferase
MRRTPEELILEYEQKHIVFEEFTSFCRKEIEYALKEADIWYQVVQERTKTKESLSRKLKADTVQVKSIKDIRDLSGVRVITYLDPELKKIQESLWWNRKIGRLKVLRMDGAYRDPGFFGKYITLSIDEENCPGVPEAFKGLKCEFQLTTIFQHGWAEVYHRSVRSVRDDLSDLSEDEVKALERKYEEMVKGPLRDATDNLHFLYQQAGKLNQGVGYKIEDPVEAISEAKDLNEANDGLGAVEDAIERFGGLIPSLTRALPKLIAYRSLISSLPAVQKIVSGMKFKGASKTQCLRRLLKVNRLLGFTDVGAFLKFLFAIWKDEPEVKDECESQLREFLEWNIRNLRAWGYAAHLEISKELDTLFKQATQEEWAFFLKSAEHLLKFQLEGAWESDLNQISVPFGCVRIDDELERIRQVALSWLTTIASEATDTNLKAHALHSLFHAVKCPFTPQGSIPAANDLVKKECDSLLNNFILQIPEMSFPEMTHILEHCRDLEQSYQQENIASDKAKEMIRIIEGNQRYRQFKALVGTVPYNGDFNLWEKAKEERNAQGRKFGLQISESNWKEWKQTILDVCSFQGKLGTSHFDAFEELLKGICEASPQRAAQLIIENVEQVGQFSSRIICELFENVKAEGIKSLLLKNLKSSVAVSDIAHGIFWSKHVDAEFILEAIAAIDIKRFPDMVGILIENLLRRENLSVNTQEKIIVTIEKLSEVKNFSWFRFFFKGHAKALNSFSTDQWKRLLLCLVPHPRLDYQVEEILIAAAEKDPSIVLDFLLERLKVGRNKEVDDHFFDAHPRSMRRLSSIMERDLEKITKRLIDAFISSDYIGRQFYAGALMSELIPLNSPTLSTWLNSLADSKKPADHELLIDALAPFGNTVLAHPFYRQLISNKRCSKKLWNDIASRLLHIESYAGHDGGLKQLKSFASSVSSWEETNDLIKEFKKKFGEIARTSIEGEDARVSREQSTRALDYELRTGKKPKAQGE